LKGRNSRCAVIDPLFLVIPNPLYSLLENPAWMSLKGRTFRCVVTTLFVSCHHEPASAGEGSAFPSLNTNVGACEQVALELPRICYGTGLISSRPLVTCLTDPLFLHRLAYPIGVPYSRVSN
jgi:hypothetical protein